MSMTGFGKKEAQYEDKHISIEVRSLNSKNIDINLRSPSYLRELDPEIRKELTLKMYRGKIDVNIYVEFNGETAPSKINSSVVKAYMKQLEGLGASSESERMAIALRLPETLSSEKDILGEDERKTFYKILNEVIKDLEARFHIDGTTFSDNANETAYREGQRTVVLFLKSMLKDKPKREDIIET